MKKDKNLLSWVFSMLMIFHYMVAGVFSIGWVNHNDYFALGMYFYSCFMGLIFQILYIRQIIQEEKK